MTKSGAGKLVERERIYRQLNKDMDGRRILYWRANTGWGKTTTMLQYFAYMKIPYISLNVMAEDFMEQLKQAASKENAHVLIDNLHELDTDKLYGFNEYLEQISGNTKFYLLGRAWLPSYLKKYEITNELVYYGNEQLAINDSEAAELLELYGISCSSKLLSQIVRQTEGWMLYLILMTRRGKNITSLDDKLIELTRLDLFDYMDHNLWTHWDSDIKSFLLNMGHLESFSEKEACVICGKSDVTAILNKIQCTSSYLIQDDDTHYHFKTPMQFYLARKQKQNYDEATIKQRYENTALYFSMGNDIPNALKYYNLAEDRQKMTEILIENANSLVGDAYFYELEKYYLDIDEESIAQSPEMMTAMAMLHSLSMRTEESDRYIKQLEEFERQLPVSDARKKIARSKLGYLQFAIPHRGSSTIIEKFQRLSKTQTKMQQTSISGDMPSIMSGGLDFCEWSKKDRRLYQTMKLPMSIVFGKYADGIAEIALGESLFEKNRDGNYTESMMLLNSGRTSSEIAGNLQLQFAANGLLARMFVSEGRQSTALNMMENYYEKVTKSSKRQLPLNAEAFLIRLHMLMDEKEMAEVWLNERAPNEYEHFFILERYRYLTKVRVYIVKKMYLEALSLLDQLEQYFSMYERRYNLAEAKLLRSITLYHMNNQSWEQELQKALAIACEYQFFRMVADFGAAILPMLTEYCKQIRKELENVKSEKTAKAKEKAYCNYLDTLLQTTKRQAEYYPWYLTNREQPNRKLTVAEEKVLELLVQGLTNREIADRLQISITTVKTHTGNIYSKYNVKNRTSAILKAKQYENVKR